MDDFAAVAARFDRLSRDLNGAGLRAIVSAVALDAKKDIRKEVADDIGGDRQMSNWGRFKFDAGYDIESDHRAVILPRPANPWQVLEKGRRGGHKVPKGRRRSKVYATPFGLRTATRDHPWTGSSSRGKRTWTKAALTIERKTPQRVHEQTTAVIGRHFKRG